MRIIHEYRPRVGLGRGRSKLDMEFLDDATNRWLNRGRESGKKKAMCLVHLNGFLLFWQERQWRLAGKQI